MDKIKGMKLIFKKECDGIFSHIDTIFNNDDIEINLTAWDPDGIKILYHYPDSDDYDTSKTMTLEQFGNIIRKFEGDADLVDEHKKILERNEQLFQECQKLKEEIQSYKIVINSLKGLI